VPVATNNSPPAITAKPDPTPPAPAPQRDPEPRAAQEEPEAAPAEEPAVSSSTGMWAVQLGSFSNRENAERLAADLRKRGFFPFLSQVSTGSGDLHRVRIGPQKDRASAEAVAAELQKAGQKGQVVPHP
jgi:DedD protein